MSYPEFQSEEKSVQLTPEDLEILSEYSWDMAGYTSRFGFFYQGNEKADIDGLTKWQAEHIFQLTPTPLGMEDELQNMEKTRRINKEKKKEISKKNEAIGEAYHAKAVRETLWKLSWRDRMILQARNAICHNCGGMRPMKEQYTFREISKLIGSSTDKGAEKAYHTAMDRFTA